MSKGRRLDPVNVVVWLLILITGIAPWVLLCRAAHGAEAVSRQECRFQGLQSGDWTQREEDYTARCVVRRWPVSGGLSKLRRVGRCESGWNRMAYNSDGPYVGLFQHVLSAWLGRVREFTPPHWDLQTSWRNSRTQIVVTVRYVRRYGWGAWPRCGD